MACGIQFPYAISQVCGWLVGWLFIFCFVLVVCVVVCFFLLVVVLFCFSGCPGVRVLFSESHLFF